MSARVRGQRRSRLRRILRGMRLNFITLGLLIVLTVLGLSLIRTSLLKNAQETGTALTQIYAAEGESNLTIYETLLSFGTSSISDRLASKTSWPPTPGTATTPMMSPPRNGIRKRARPEAR